ncbi:uncharacterized protein LY89DRAFT_715948 [Mollisia scopiformis]|uniref:Transcriptional regulatory protein RXT2 N-terminal domain-containing protein n=1 Tax=Mollisia scopiformis TaxID=149040 RepID=A0A194XK86_MOLSC|nr:uncharacterized protein LY89DRAFT_715948 [Mollisia scopiformis]KUJ20573.1 hypothetical protein LY89DRAFT_715948 [Mollisia scopiformis]
MMSQAEIFAEAIVGMKKALKRKAYDSDSDSSIEQLTNRGNKLRKKARFVHEGQLAPPSGPNVYKRTIDHAGYQRDIISHNPVLVDEDGSEIASDDEGEVAQAARATAAEFDPYADVRIEQLLAPLTAASDLPDHPTLSKPFTSKTLTELTKHAGDMVQKEKASLWRIKHLLTRLSGDNTWIPCESVETENDFSLFLDERYQGHGLLKRGTVRDEADQGSTGTMASDDVDPTARLLTMQAHANESAEEGSGNGKQVVNEDVQMTSVIENAAPEQGAPLPNGEPSLEGPLTSSKMDQLVELQGNEDADGLSAQLPGGPLPKTSDEAVDGNADNVDADMMDTEEGVPVPTRMRTRAQAQAASDNTARTRSITPEAGNEDFIHPYFLAPPSSHPDRNLGLPQHEADETRRLLQLYIQKQEEVCRGAEKVYSGLLRADRYRKLVMKWAKAEVHVRDMSDGEDWYEKEEWGLDEDLKKGQDEEEEDAATTAKKTRTRRQ